MAKLWNTSSMDVEQQKSSFIDSGNEKHHNHLGKQFGRLLKNKKNISYNTFSC